MSPPPNHPSQAPSPSLTGPLDLSHLPLARRELLARGLSLAAGLAGLSALAALAGCSGSTNLVGRPIPPDPTVRPIPGGIGQSRGPGLATGPLGSPATSLPAGIIPRSRWATQGPNPALANRMGRVQRITVHHDAIGPFTDTSSTAAAGRLESIRRSHVSNEWADIGYHYAIDPAGRVWEGRPLSLQGAHVKDQNPGNLGIVVLGNYELQRPTPQAMRALDTLLASEMRRHGVPLREVRTHREMAPTACPGRHLQGYMDTTRARGGDLIALA